MFLAVYGYENEVGPFQLSVETSPRGMNTDCSNAVELFNRIPHTVDPAYAWAASNLCGDADYIQTFMFSGLNSTIINVKFSFSVPNQVPIIVWYTDDECSDCNLKFEITGNVSHKVSFKSKFAIIVSYPDVNNANRFTILVDQPTLSEIAKPIRTGELTSMLSSTELLYNSFSFLCRGAESVAAILVFSPHLDYQEIRVTFSGFRYDVLYSHDLE